MILINATSLKPVPKFITASINHLLKVLSKCIYSILILMTREILWFGSLRFQIKTLRIQTFNPRILLASFNPDTKSVKV